MKQFFFEIFTWWNRQTMGTRLTTWRKGERVGEDELGNVYYRTKGGAKDKALGFERRWVIYKGEADASLIPAGWHGWMHHRVDTPPSKEKYVAREWQKSHLGNKTGSAEAYRPAGSTLSNGTRPAATGDYKPWSPGN